MIIEELNPAVMRIAALIECKTGGNRTLFAERIGWSKQRLSNVLSGKAWGLVTVETMLKAFPDLNARWLLFGEGNMLSIHTPHFGQKYENILAYEQFLPYMTEAECALLSAGKTDWAATDIERWQLMRKQHNATINARFRKAYEKQGLQWQDVQ